jgi:hypothetical protein
MRPPHIKLIRKSLNTISVYFITLDFTTGKFIFYERLGGRRRRIVVGFMQLMPITTNVVSFNPAQSRCTR